MSNQTRLHHLPLHILVVNHFVWMYLYVWMFVCVSGLLSPPLNITVEFLDFAGLVHWSPSPENPSNTNHTVQLKAIEKDKNWRNLSDCMQTAAMMCSLDIPLTPDNLFAQYQVRVRAEGAGQISNWSNPSQTTQPYADTLLSAPSMKLRVETHTVYVSLTHPLTILVNLSYDLTLHDEKGGSQTTVKVRSHKEFWNLSTDRNYCLTASANHQLLHHMTTKECVHLPRDSSVPDFGRFKGLPVVLSVLLAALIGLIAVTHRFLKTRAQTPTALGVCKQSKCRWLTPERVACELVRLEEVLNEEIEDQLEVSTNYILRENMAPLIESQGGSQEGSHGGSQGASQGASHGGSQGASQGSDTLPIALPTLLGSNSGYKYWDCSDSEGSDCNFNLETQVEQQEEECMEVNSTSSSLSPFSGYEHHAPVTL